MQILRSVAFRPYLFRNRCPVGGVLIALGTEVFGSLRRFEVGAFCARLGYDFTEYLRVFKHGAGTQMVVVKGLVLVVFEEKRLAQAVKYAHIVYVRAGIVDKYAGLNVARSVYVHIPLAAGNAAADELAVILEVDGEYLLAAFKTADLAYSVLHI